MMAGLEALAGPVEAGGIVGPRRAISNRGGGAKSPGADRRAPSKGLFLPRAFLGGGFDGAVDQRFGRLADATVAAAGAVEVLDDSFDRHVGFQHQAALAI